MRTATRNNQPARRTTHTSTTGRTTSRLAGRGGMGMRRARKRSVLLGVLSIVAFGLFWVLLMVAADSAINAGCPGER
jgi:hypothetical protein